MQMARVQETASEDAAYLYLLRQYNRKPNTRMSHLIFSVTDSFDTVCLKPKCACMTVTQ